MASDGVGRPVPPPGPAPEAGRGRPLALTLRPWLPLAGLALSIGELLTFIALGNLIGFPLAVLTVLVISLLGILLVRREGLRAWRGFRQAVEQGRQPGNQITDGLVGLGGAVLLASPGLITSAAGALLLTPPLRAVARSRVQARAERRMSPAGAADLFGPRRVRVQYPEPSRPDQPAGGEPVVEGEVIDPGGREPPRAAR